MNTVPFQDGIDELLGAAPFEVYPNSNEGSFVLQMKNVVQEKLQVTLYDAVGRQVFRTTYNASGSNSYRLNTELPTGMYFMHVKSGSVVASRKVMVR